MKKFLFIFISLVLLMPIKAQDRGLNRHDFLYAGEAKQLKISIVENGQVSWEYTFPYTRGEISDAILMTDGNILVAHRYGIAEVTKNKEIVWSYDAPEGTEIHTIQPIGKTHVVFVMNALPAKAVVMKIPTCKIVHEFELPASKSVHGQFRNARLTARGTLLVANMGLGFVGEYDYDGKELARWEVPGAWSVTELPNKNMLVVGGGGNVKEIARDGSVVWQTNTLKHGITQLQKAVRLKNGNTIINNWWNEWGKTPLDSLNAPLQAIEVDREGKVVWELSSWKEPALGPSTTIQPLDQLVNREHLFFGKMNK